MYIEIGNWRPTRRKKSSSSSSFKCERGLRGGSDDDDDGRKNFRKVSDNATFFAATPEIELCILTSSHSCPRHRKNIILYSCYYYVLCTDSAYMQNWIVCGGFKRRTSFI